MQNAEGTLIEWDWEATESQCLDEGPPGKAGQSGSLVPSARLKGGTIA